MPFFSSLFAGAVLFGCAKVVYEVIDEEPTVAENSGTAAGKAGHESATPGQSLVKSIGATWQSFCDSAGSSLAELEQEYNQFIREKIDPLFGATREKQLQTLDAAAGQQPTTPYERKVNRNLGVSVGITAAALVTAPLGSLVQLGVTVPLALVVAKDMYKAAYESVLKRHRPTLPLLSAVNVTAIWVGGYYLIGGVVLTLIHLGMKLSLITEQRSHKRLASIFGQQPRKIWVLVDGAEIEIPFEQLRVGDAVVVSAGQTIAVDGIIEQGYASIDQRMLTGEAQPAENGIGDRVLATTVVLSGHIVVRAEQAGSETVAAKIGEMLEKTASYQMGITTKAYKFAEASVTPTLVAAGLALLTVGYSAMVAITSTVFGFNLVISGPMALMAYLEASSRQRILVKDGRSFELLTTIDTVVFDKTGTLTLEQPHVARVCVFGSTSAADVLRYTASVEQRQTHPIASAILAYAREQQVSLANIADIRYEMGYGLRAEIDGKLIRVGSDRFMTLENIPLPQEALALQEQSHAQGYSLVMVALGDELVGAIELEPTIRPEAASVLAELRRRKLDICIISGDQEGPTRRLAQTLGIDHYFANTLPENKAQIVEQLQKEGRAVCFVGDGINDSIALKKANVSVSLSGATNVATDTAQVVLMDSTLQQLPLLFKLAEEMDANLKACLALAIVPGVGIWAGVFFLNLGILGAAVIYEASIWLGVGNALRPLLKYRQPKAALPAESTTAAA